MTREFVLPDLGEGLTEAEVVAWLVAPGDEVEIDQPVVELESAKSVVQLPCPFSGVVTALGGSVGQVLHAGDVLLTLETAGIPGGGEEPGASGSRHGEPSASSDDGEPSASGRDDAEPGASGSGDGESGAVLIGYGTRPVAATVRPTRSTSRFGRGRPNATGRSVSGRASPAPGDASRPDAPLAEASATDGEAVTSAGPATGTGRRSPVISPIVRRLAREHGFDASLLVGTGHDHLVLRRDVERAIAGAEKQPASSAPTPRTAQSIDGRADAPAQPGPARARGAGTPDVQRPGGAGTPDVERITLDRRAQTAAALFERSRREIPDATVWLDVDATGLLVARRELERISGLRFGVSALIARFAIAGLVRHPRVNASFDPDRREIILHRAVHLGVATQTSRGLTVPVIHDAERMTLRELRAALAERAEQAAAAAFPPDALAGGTFTLNNYGALGVDGSAAILNYPQAAMLGIGRLVERPWVVDGALAVRTVTELTLSFDHRVCDGAEAAAFLTFVAGCIEQPLMLLTDV